MLGKLDQDTVMVVSDHGAGDIRKVFDPDQWLEREGFLVPRKGATFEGLLRQLGKRGRKLQRRSCPPPPADTCADACRECATW